MNIEFFVIGVALILVSAALFVWRSLPPWVVAVVGFALAMAGRQGILGFHLGQPQSSREACEWRCDALYGHRDELASQFALCVGTCP
jgi:hypothetical protein